MRGPMTTRQWGLLLALSILWGGSFFFMAVALRGFPPLTIVLARMSLAGIALAITCVALGHRPPATRQAWIACVGMGVLNSAIPFSLVVTAQQFIPSGLAAVVNAATPVFAVLCAHFLARDERLTAPRLVGTLTGLAGVLVLAGPAALTSGHAQELLGILLALGACLSYGVSGVWARRLKTTGLPPLTIAATQCSAAALVLLPLVVAFDQPWALPVPDGVVLGAVLGLGLLSTGLGYVLFFTLIAGAGATNAMLVTLLVPVTAVLLGTLVLGEVLAPRHLGGMAVIAAGLLILDGRLLRRFRAR